MTLAYCICSLIQCEAQEAIVHIISMQLQRKGIANFWACIIVAQESMG